MPIECAENAAARALNVLCLGDALSILDKLILQLSKMPRIGRRAAGRIAISLLSDKIRSAELLLALDLAMNKINPCKICGCLSESELCEYCADATRGGTLAIVRDFSDVLVLEKSGVFHGRYHIIGGLLSGANGITPDDLNIWNIAERIQAEGVVEIIFVLPNTMEGKTTQSYIMSKLVGAENVDTSVRFSELASGVPMGGDLDYIDDGTLTLAFGGRKQII